MLNQLAKEAHQTAVEHGWWDPEPTFGELVAMMHSELSEAVEEYRNGMPLVYCTNPECEIKSSDMGVNTCIGVCGFGGGKAKPEGIAVEMADCIIRILDWAGKKNIDMDAIIREKMEYNKTRPYRHGGKIL